MRSICILLIIIVLTGVVLPISGCTLPSGNSAEAADYYQKFSRSQQSLANLTAAYDARAGVTMSQPETKAWIELDKNLTTDLLTTSNETIDAGNVYLQHLQPDSREYNTVVSNEATIKANIDVAKSRYNNWTDTYNHWWGAEYGEFAHL